MTSATPGPQKWWSTNTMNFKANRPESPPSKHPQKKTREKFTRAWHAKTATLQSCLPYRRGTVAEEQILRCHLIRHGCKGANCWRHQIWNSITCQTASFQFGMNVNPQCISCLIGKCPIFVADPHPPIKQRGLNIHAWLILFGINSFRPIVGLRTFWLDIRTLKKWYLQYAAHSIMPVQSLNLQVSIVICINIIYKYTVGMIILNTSALFVT